MRTRHTPPDKVADRRDARLARAAFVASVAPAVRMALEQAVARLVVPALPRPGILATYAAIGDEIDPAEIESRAVALGWTLAFPRVSKHAPLGFHPATRAELQPGVLGIPEPPANLPIVRPDALLVPLLAADLQGNRLGQGGGYYDRTLALLRLQRPTMAIGIAWDAQIVRRIATEHWDEPLDALATPTAFHAFNLGATASA